MIATSSIAGCVPSPILTTYCSTKVFVTYLAQGLDYELKDKVDIKSYAPGYVATKLAKRSTKDLGFFTISPEKSAHVCFRDVGIESYSHGSIGHDFHAWLVNKIHYITTAMTIKWINKAGKEGLQDRMDALTAKYEENLSKEKKQ